MSLSCFMAPSVGAMLCVLLVLSFLRVWELGHWEPVGAYRQIQPISILNGDAATPEMGVLFIPLPLVVFFLEYDLSWFYHRLKT